MSSLNYSSQAMLNIPLFDKDAKEIRIYLEGKEDIPFWEDVFKNIIPQPYEIILDYKGGIEELFKIIDAVKGQQSFIVAMDSEYDDIISDKDSYANFLTIFTKRHSIENFLFCEKSIVKAVAKLNRVQYQAIKNDGDFSSFIQSLSHSLEKLLYLDCLKVKEPSKFPPSTHILSRESNIAKLTQKGHYIPSDKKIQDFISSNSLEDMDISHIITLFKNKKLYHYLNGHFITYAIFTFINSKLEEKRKVGHDTLYDVLYGNCEACDEKCTDYKNLKAKANKVIDYYIKTLT